MMKKCYLWKCVFLLILASLFSCESSVEVQQENDLKIVGGAPLKGDNPGIYSTVAIYSQRERFGFCTGTVVAEDLVVTAAHCLVKFKNGTTVREPSDLKIVFANHRDQIDGNSRQVIQVDYNKRFTGPVSKGGDIAWVKFNGGLPSGFKPMPILTNPQYMKSNTKVTLVGYGFENEIYIGDGFKKSVDVAVRQYNHSGDRSGMIFVGGTYGKGPCYGDSGGPAYLNVANRWFLVGATSGRDVITVRPEESKTCEDSYAVYTHVGYFAQWIEKTSGVKLKLYQNPNDAPISENPGVNPEDPFPGPDPGVNPNPEIIPTGEPSFKIVGNTVYFKNISSKIGDISLHKFGNADILQQIYPQGDKIDFSVPLTFDIRRLAAGQKLRIRAVFIGGGDVIGTADFEYDPSNTQTEPIPTPNPTPNPEPEPGVITTGGGSFSISGYNAHFKGIPSNITEISLRQFGNSNILQKIIRRGTNPDLTSPLSFDIKRLANGKKIRIQAIFKAGDVEKSSATFEYDPSNM